MESTIIQVSNHHAVSDASTNATSVKATFTRVYRFTCYNIGEADAWLKIYDKASAPTVGTDTPAVILLLPAGGGNNLTLESPLYLSNGLAYALTTGIANADTGAVPADEISVGIGYL